MLGFRELCGDVGEHEELRVGARAGEHVYALVGELHAAVFLVDDEIQRLGSLGHLA